ncbi:MAG: hypothetical protein AAFP93_01775, partial [Bacteroidota bacterium]
MHACNGEQIEIALRVQPSKHLHEKSQTQPHSGAVVIEASWQAEESELEGMPRLLGGMQQFSSSDEGNADIKKSTDKKTQQSATAATRYGLRPREIDKDGNCLFRAVAAQLQEAPFNVKCPTSQDYHSVIRHVA